MTDLNRLETALRNADAAGDTAAATKIAKAIRAARGAPVQTGWKDRLDDDANSLASSVTSGAHELLGMFGNAREAQSGIINRGMQYLGASPETSNAVAGAAEWLNPITKFAPTGEQLKQATGFQPHQSQYPEGPYIQAAGEMVPGAAVMPGTAASKVLTPALAGPASEFAGQVAEKFAPEWAPQVRAGTAIVMSILTGRSGGPKDLTTADKLKIKNEAYRVAKQNGEVVPPEIFDEILNRVGNAAYKAGARPHLADQSIAALKYADEYSGKAIPVAELDDVRQILKAPSEGLPSRDAHVSRSMTGEFDNAVDELATDVHGEARKLYRDYKNSQLVDRLNHKIDLRASQYSQSGKENATRAVYRALADNESKTRFMDQATRDAIDKVAMGGSVENAARYAGKYAPTSVVASIPTLAAVLSGNYDVAAALMGTGIAGRMLSSALTSKNRKMAEELIKRGGEAGKKAWDSARDKQQAERLARALLTAGGAR